MLRPKRSCSLNLTNNQWIFSISSWHYSNSLEISRTAQVAELEGFNAMPASVMARQQDKPLNHNYI